MPRARGGSSARVSVRAGRVAVGWVNGETTLALVCRVSEGTVGCRARPGTRRTAPARECLEIARRALVWAGAARSAGAREARRHSTVRTVVRRVGADAGWTAVRPAPAGQWQAAARPAQASAGRVAVRETTARIQGGSSIRTSPEAPRGRCLRSRSSRPGGDGRRAVSSCLRGQAAQRSWWVAGPVSWARGGTPRPVVWAAVRRASGWRGTPRTVRTAG